MRAYRNGFIEGVLREICLSSICSAVYLSAVNRFLSMERKLMSAIIEALHPEA
jgi:hypothetical protein